MCFPDEVRVVVGWPPLLAIEFFDGLGQPHVIHRPNGARRQTQALSRGKRPGNSPIEPGLLPVHDLTRADAAVDPDRDA